MADGLEANIKKYTEQLAQDPKSRAFVPLSDAYRQSGRCEEAIAVAQEGLKFNPHYVTGKIALARAHFENGDVQQAFELLDAVLLTSPDNLLANRIFAEVSSQMGETDKAISALKRVISLEPSDERSKSLLQRIEKGAAAPPARASVTPPPIAQAAPAPMPSPPLPGVQSVTLAELYRTQGHLKDALKVYKELRDKEPGNAVYASKIAELEAALAPKTPPPQKMGISHRQIYESLLQRITERRRSL